MAKSANQKLKLIFLLQMLSETSAEHPVSMNDMIAMLMEKGIRAERKSIYDDIDTLRSLGFQITSRRGRGASYYAEGVSGALTKIPEAKAAGKTGSGESGSMIRAVPELFSGSERITLRCTRRAAMTILEVSGQKAQMEELADDGKKKKKRNTLVTWQGNTGEDLFRFLAGFGTEVLLTFPANAGKEYRKYLKEIRSLYD